VSAFLLSDPAEVLGGGERDGHCTGADGRGEDEAPRARRSHREVRGSEALVRRHQEHPREGRDRSGPRGEGRPAHAGRHDVPREVVEPGRGHQGLRVGPRTGLAQLECDHAAQGDVREAPRLGKARPRHGARGRAHGRERPRDSLRRDGAARDGAPPQARDLHRPLAEGSSVRSGSERRARSALGPLRART